MTSKTANSVIRYLPDRTVGVLDRQQAGKTVQDVLGFGGGIPIVASMREGLALGPTAILIGIAPQGGRMPTEWRALAGRGARSRLRSLERSPHLSRRRSTARGEGARPADGRSWISAARRPTCRSPRGWRRRWIRWWSSRSGTDCNVGKMTAQLQITRQLNERGVRTRFVATGQTGIMIEGWGIAVDAVVADFIAGAAERLVLEGSQGCRHRPGGRAGEHQPSGLLRRDPRPAPRLVPRCADPLSPVRAGSTSATTARRRGSASRRSPTTSGCTRASAAAVHPTKVIAISLNTYDMTDTEARRACEAAARETGLPATDPVRFDPTPLVEAVVSAGTVTNRSGSASHGDPRLGGVSVRAKGKRWWSCRLAPRSSAMLPGAPSRLPSSFLLRRALAFAHPGEPLGAWVRMGRWPLHLRARGRALLASPDLGFLLRRCGRVVVRDSHGAVALDAERLIAWRTLQIVVGAPFLPAVRGAPGALSRAPRG